jgi:hypothetical protein
MGWRPTATALLGLLCLAPARAARAAEPGAELTISVLTFGPGDHPFYKFGHNAILVHDALRGRDDVYNYGTFDYRARTLVPDFLHGRLQYWLSVASLEVTVEQYRSENRSVTAQELALSAAQRRALVERLGRAALPANRYYRYDYYRDNCSTRVRDVIDGVLDGRLRDASRGPATTAVATLLAASSIAGLGLKVLPWFDQSNGQTIALLLPVWLGAAAGARASTRLSPRQPREAPAAGPGSRAPPREPRTRDPAARRHPSV